MVDMASEATVAAASAAGENVCPICKEALGSTGGGVYAMACGHPYCVGCIQFWARRTGTNVDVDMKCPVCKTTAQEVQQRALELGASGSSSGSAMAQRQDKKVNASRNINVRHICFG